MTELHFREGDRPRPTLGSLAPMLLGMSVQLVILYFRMGLAGVWITLGLLLVVAVVSLAMRRWAETRADEQGLSVRWGPGRQRHYAWAEVRWLEIREKSSQYGTIRSGRITLVGGRRHLLPGLSSGSLSPRPGLDADFGRLRALWVAHQDATFVATPPARVPLRRRLRGLVPGVLSVLLLALAVAATVSAFGLLGNARVLESLPGCGVGGNQGAFVCAPQDALRVHSASAQGSLFGSSTATLTDPGGVVYTATFGAANPLVEHARPGDPVVITRDFTDDATYSVRYRGHEYPTTDSPRVEIMPAVTAAVAFGAAGLLLAGWAVASWRRRPGAGYPWWAPLSLPAVAWAVAVATQVEREPSPLTLGQYVPGLVLLALGLALAAWLRRRGRGVPVAQPLMPFAA